ncbi:MAG: RNA-binding protein [Pyrinomonadaceae bacterium]
MSMKLYVGNLSFQTSSQELEELFAAIGPVDSASVVEDRETGRSRGFGFIEMASQEDGEKAIAELNGKDVSGREIKVNEAKPREDRGGGGGGGGGRGGYDGGGGGGGGGGYGGGSNRW